jgi:hypothetical protein
MLVLVLGIVELQPGDDVGVTEQQLDALTLLFGHAATSLVDWTEVRR